MHQNNLLVLVEPLIRSAGNQVMVHFRKQQSFHIDETIEQFLIEGLRPIISGAGFFCEESGKQPGNAYTWVIDPLDGTTNFMRGIPYFCISVALIFQEKPVFSVTYNPVLDEFFYAIKDGGSWLNGKRITVSTITDTSRAMVVGFPLIKQSHISNIHIRKQGAFCLDQAYCAAGFVDVFVAQNVRWWDVAAGILLVEEAGGVATRWDGTMITSEPGSVLLGSNICEKMQKLLNFHDEI